MENERVSLINTCKYQIHDSLPCSRLPVRLLRLNTGWTFCAGSSFRSLYVQYLYIAKFDFKELSEHYLLMLLRNQLLRLNQMDMYDNVSDISNNYVRYYLKTLEDNSI